MIALELIWGAQLAACAAYAHGLFGKRGGRRALAKGVLGVAWLALTLQLLFAWKSAGLWQPPWLSLAETLTFGAWALVSVQLVAELRLGASEAGFFCTALAATAGGIAVFALGRAPEAVARGAILDSILHNPWVWIHAPSGALGYGLFLLSAFLSILWLIRSGVAGERFLTVLAAASLLTLSCEGPRTWMVNVSTLGYAIYLTLSVFGMWLESQDRRLNAEIELQQAGLSAKSGAPRKRKGLRRVLKAIFCISWLALIAALYRARAVDSPERLVWLVFLAVLSGAALVYSAREGVIQERLAEPESFDRWSFQAALYAFPLLTIHGVSGSVWAYDAWGSYWSWQPQQSWVFMAWLYLALILHLKRGKTSTAVVTSAGIGFVLAAIASAGVHGFWPAR